MELTPQLLTDEIDFRIAVRGYDRNEVDDFLERVAVAVGQLQTQLGKAITRAKTAEKRVVELESGIDDAATPITRNAEVDEVIEPVSEPEPVEEPEVVAEPVQEIVARPVPKAPEVVPDAPISSDDALNEELRRTLVLAQRTADAAIREAKEQARKIVDDAADEATKSKELLAKETAQERAAARERLLQEISDLESMRESMRGDAAVLERYLGTERAKVRETIQVLRRLVDDPKSFTPDAMPELSEVAVPALDEPQVAITSDDSDVSEVPVAPDSPSDSDFVTQAIAEPEVQTSPELDAEPATDSVPAPATESASETVPDSAPVAEVEMEVESESELPAESDPAESDPAESAPAESAPAESAPAEPVAPPASSALPKRDVSTSASLGQLFDAAQEPKDWRSAGTDRGDQGPHTQPVAAARFEEESDDAFLAELRRAMDEDEPLGPQRDA